MTLSCVCTLHRLCSFQHFDAAFMIWCTMITDPWKKKRADKKNPFYSGNPLWFHGDLLHNTTNKCDLILLQLKTSEQRYHKTDLNCVEATCMQFSSCQKACTKAAISDFQHERQSFLLFLYQQCSPDTLLCSYNGGYIAVKSKPLLFILPCHEGDHQLRVRCYSESKPILWESEMCLTTISQTTPHQTASNPTGPARNSALSVCCKLHT